ncbi:hypothetical protein GE09DRAFT_1195599 [Coniochaeta sp. 2T2.1]|nr:hypothetical protein GE09DRAFT_1195599 [Coniochaeta sp. 2T2.1]
MDSASTSSYFQRRSALEGRVKRARSESDEDNEPLRKRYTRQHVRPAWQIGYRSHGFTSVNPAVREEDVDETKSIDIGSYDTTSDSGSDGALDPWTLKDDADLEAAGAQAGNEPDANTANNHSDISARGHFGQNPSADEDILHFCRRMGYVPAGTPIPTGSRIQPFLKPKPVRGLDLNRCSTAHPWHPNNKGNSNCNQGANCSFVKDARQVPAIGDTTLAPHASFFPAEASSAAPEVNIVANLATPPLAAHTASRPTATVEAPPATGSHWAGNTLLESHAQPRPSVFLPPISSFDFKPPGTLTPSHVPAYNMSRLDNCGAPDAFPNTSLDASYGPSAFPTPKSDPFVHINTAYPPRPEFGSGPPVGYGRNASSGAVGGFSGSWSGPAPHGTFNKENEFYPNTGRGAIRAARSPPVARPSPSFGTQYTLASKPSFEPVPPFSH